jgi:aryl-phospho-beta-D-glucosidase BglC (GH1 family)
MNNRPVVPRLVCALVLFAALAAGRPSSADSILKYSGVNLSGAEFGQGHLPGTYSSDYIYPLQSEVNYFKSKGMNTIRLPFRWERLQHTNHGTLDSTELTRMSTFVSGATGAGMYVILDPHNFERYYPDPINFQSSAQGLIGSDVPDSDFADFWSRVATIFKSNDHVFFNLMNEPNSVPEDQLVTSENAAIAAIRATGATNLILVPGNRYTGAWTWLNSDANGAANSDAMLNIVDSGNNYAYDVHQYFDFDGSGTHTNIGNSSGTQDASVGLTRLTNFTKWLHNNNRRGFLGEFAVANATIGTAAKLVGDETITNALKYIQTNADVWLGWTWWAGGPYWPGGPSNPGGTPVMIFLLDPANLSTTPIDKPAMTLVRGFNPLPQTMLQLAAGSKFQFTAVQGFVYQPQTAPSVAGAWTSFGASITGNGGTTNISIPASTVGNGFYRVMVTHAP